MKQAKIISSSSGMGMHKHGISGHTINNTHFTGKKSHKSHKRKAK